MSIFNKLLRKKTAANPAASPVPNPLADNETQKVSESRTRASNLLKDLAGDLNIANTARMSAREKERRAIVTAKMEGRTQEKICYPIEDDILKRYLMDITALHYGISSAGVTILDTRELDEQISWLAESMRDAIRNNQPGTAKVIYEALCWGVTVGRKDISEVEKKHEAEIISNRLEIFEAHKTNVQAYKAMELLRAELKKKKTERAQETEKLARVQEEMHRVHCKSQEDVAVMECLELALMGDPTYKPESDEEKRLMVLMQTEEIPLIKSIAALDKFIDQEELDETNYMEACNQAEEALLLLSQEYYPDLKDSMNRLSDYVRHHVDEVNDRIDGMHLALDYFDNVIASIVETPIQKKHRINNIRIHLEAKRKREKQEQSIEDRARIIAEKRAADKQKVEQQAAEQQTNAQKAQHKIMYTN